MMDVYIEKKELQKIMEENPEEEYSERVKKYAQVEPELQEWADSENERMKTVLTKMKDEFFENEAFKDRGYDRETLDQVFNEIIG